jgi:hypothetical protein
MVSDSQERKRGEKRCILRGQLIAAGLLVWLLAQTLVGTAAGVEDSDLRRRQLAQERARALARELVSGILDVQVRQLAENGLTNLPIYDEIRDMQANIDALVEEQMAEVVRLLVLAQEGTREERLQHFNQARSKIRDVVVRLMAERQKLLRRMQVARLAAQVRELIALQTRTLQATDQLPERALDDRERAALDAAQDQRDVRSMFLVLVETLVDVSAWGGQVGAGASDGLRILKAAQVDPELDRAQTLLDGGSFQEATTSQKAVIKGLRALLEKVEQTQGLISGDREAALKMVRDLIAQQEQLRDQVRQTEQLAADQVEQLVAEQAQIHKSLGALSEMLEQAPASQPLLEQAKASAYEAAAQLFAQDQAATVAEQGRVIGALAEIEQQLQHELATLRDDQSAAELAAERARLEQLRDDLQAVAARQERVVERAAEQPAEARREQQQVAADLAQAQQRASPDETDLPGVIESRLADARAAVQESAGQLAEQSTEAAPARREAAVEAQGAIEQALAETTAQLADTARRQLAVELGELARAAEALERAAASEREIAHAAAQAADSDGLTAEQADRLREENDEVQTVADKVAEGVADAVPEAVRQLQQAAGPITETAAQIDAAGQQPGQPSVDAAHRMARSATQASQELQRAAATLREAARASARELVTLAEGQIDDVARVQTPVEQTLAALPQSAEQIRQQLQQAIDHVQQARVEQQRASGHAQAADAAQFARQVTQAASLQAAAERAADDVASGRANTPLDAAARQQEVAERTAELAQQTDGPAADRLQQAAAAAAEAARETLGGDPNRARLARQAASDAIAAAADAASQAAAAAEQMDPGPADAAAQARVEELAGQAEQLAQAAAPQAAGSLNDAGMQARSAQNAIAQNDAGRVQQAQQAADQALEQAEQQLQDAAEQLAAAQEEQNAQQAQQAGQLADAAAAVSPDAAAALRSAEQAAGQADTDPSPQDAEPSDLPFTAGQTMQRSLERAAASLAARRQEIQRDRDVAEAVADLIQQQQEARQEIATQSERLTEMPPPQPESDNQPAPEQIASARALQRATRQFAQAQRATGQGAVEISDQEQVANVPLREGLEAASQLAMGLPVEPTDATPPVEPSSAAESAAASGDTPPPSGTVAGTEPAGAPTAGAAATQPGSQQPSTALGTGLVPNAPEATAGQIAGQQAMTRAAQTLAMAPPEAATADAAAGSPSAAGPQDGLQQPEAASMAASATESQVASTSGETADSQSDASQSQGSEPVSQQDSRSGDGGSTAEIRTRMFQDEPWFARLPPALRQAIEARSRRRAPRGYEERLRRYFESVD